MGSPEGLARPLIGREPRRISLADPARASQTAQMPSGCTITTHDPREDDDATLAEHIAFANALLAEVLPDEEPSVAADYIAQIRAMPERLRMWTIRARDERGALVGAVRTAIDPEHDENPDLLFGSVQVLAGHRRSGLGTELLGRLVEVAEAEGRTRIVGSTNGLRPEGTAFAEAAGAVVKSRAHHNRLLTAKANRAQLASWVRDAATRSSDYELIAWDGPVPEDDLQRWIDLVLVMNTAPRDDLEMNDFTLTPEEVREEERISAAAGIEHWTVVARHRTTGEWAGFHDVSWLPSDPKIVHVGATAVEPRHRGHALGKWLKAAMTLRILDERPDVTDIRTGNADSNDAMLGINRAMGYEPWISTDTWELDVATARAFVDGRLVVA